MAGSLDRRQRNPMIFLVTTSPSRALSGWASSRRQPLTGMLVAVLTAVCVVACGSSTGRSSSSTAVPGRHTSSSAAAAEIAPAPVLSKIDGDEDNDIGAPSDDTNNSQALAIGHPASPVERRAITALIKRYYAAALAGNGAAACSMLFSTLEESVPEDYGVSPPGQPYMKGKTCPAVLDGVFRHFHPQLAAELPSLKVARMGVNGRHAMVILTFGKMPMREIPTSREGRIWRIGALLDTEVP